MQPHASVSTLIDLSKFTKFYPQTFYGQHLKTLDNIHHINQVGTCIYYKQYDQVKN